MESGQICVSFEEVIVMGAGEAPILFFELSERDPKRWSVSGPPSCCGVARETSGRPQAAAKDLWGDLAENHACFFWEQENNACYAAEGTTGCLSGPFPLVSEPFSMFL